ncbi:Uncharacterised protein [Neisseria meningitidis]|nr:Uncharacterised protein [Neisseria meningitidis]
MVLHHIAQRAGNVVKLAALFHAQLLGDGQLHAFDVFIVPQRLEHYIGKTQRKQVLQAFFAKVVVDAVNLPFFEITRNIGIDLLGRSQIRTQRFFQNHTHVVGVQTDFGKVFTCLREEFRRDGKIDDDIVGFFARFDQIAQSGKIVRLRNIDFEICETFDKRCPSLIGKIFFHMDFGTGFHLRQKTFGIQLAAADPQNTPFGMKQTGNMRLVQTGQQLAHRQIAGRTEQHQIKICLCTHRIISSGKNFSMPSETCFPHHAASQYRKQRQAA